MNSEREKGKQQDTELYNQTINFNKFPTIGLEIVNRAIYRKIGGQICRWIKKDKWVDMQIDIQ